MNILDCQREMRSAFLGGFAGQLVSGLIWLVAAALGTWLSPTALSFAWLGRILPSLTGLPLSNWENGGITFAIYLVQIPLSAWWLSRFQFGPLEWLWRSLTYGKKQPFVLEKA